MSNFQVESSISDDDFSRLRTIIHNHTGITIANNRRSMLFSRLQRRLRATGEATFSGYIEKVCQDSVEMQELTNRVTTNKTLFLRTPRIWAYMRSKAIPMFLEKNFNRSMKVWSAAASTGEEAYTIGMVLEEVRKSYPRFSYSILGTDISSRVLEVADSARYSDQSIHRFKQQEPDLFRNHLTETEKSFYSVSSDIRRNIQFKLHNLIEPLSNHEKYDLILLRNVLIYFSNKDQEIILRNIHQKIHPDGILIIGESESLNSLNCDFESIEPLIYRPKPAGLRQE